MMVCGELGIAVTDDEFSNSAAYLSSWLGRLRSDRKEIFRAAADAQRIADFLLAFHPDYASQTGSPESVPGADDGDAASEPEPMRAAA
jgi:antirestriction protein ArdC